MGNMQKCLIIFGTRPEAIKMAPIISAAQGQAGLETVVCVSAQHREMLDDVLETFAIRPDHDLDVMRPDQSLTGLTCRMLKSIEGVLARERPDLVLVQGDTTTTMCASLAAYYHQMRIGHVEAGLRSGDKYQPFPEEKNRHITSVLADLHFAPTPRAAQNLLREGVAEESIYITGNTVIDALQEALRKPCPGDYLAEVPEGKRLVLLTAHRRENFGHRLESICRAVRMLAAEFRDVVFVYPVHLNPRVREVVFPFLRDAPNVKLLEPLPYLPFIHLMQRASLILSDSGGIQEEAPSLNKPLLVLREVTERSEVLEVGAARLAGTDVGKIMDLTRRLLLDDAFYRSMAQAPNPFGDGQASRRIIEAILNAPPAKSP